MKTSLKLGYGIGQVSEGVKHAAFSTFLFFYYNQVLGLPGSLAGTAALLALIVDAVTDPMIGQLSDSFESRWGRRHPFMLVGAIPFGLAMTALFAPPAGLGEWGLFGWMLGWGIAVRLMLTLFFVPHLSLGAEMVRDYHERTSLIGYRVFFAYAGGIGLSITGFILFFPSSEEFPNGLLNAASYPAFGMFAALLGTASMLWTVYATRETIPSLARPQHDPDAGHPLLGFIHVFRTLRQRAFRILFATTLLFMIMAGVTQTLLVYVATYLFGFSPEHLGVLASSAVIGIFLASWIAQLLSRRFDKKPTLAICVTLGVLIAFLPIMLYIAGVLQTLTIGQRFVLVFCAHGISQAFFIGYIIIIDSMLTDTIDEHEMHTGRREEGLYFAARSLATKASYGLGSFFAGISLDLIRFPRGFNPADVPEEALRNLALLAGPVSALVFLLTIVISSRYPLDAARFREIRAVMDDRTVVVAEEH